MSSENKSNTKSEKESSQESPKASPLDQEIAKLKSHDFRVKNNAIKTLGKMKDAKAREKLFEIAKSEHYDGRLRVSAIDSLGRGSKGSELFRLLQSLAGDPKQSREIRRTCITQLTRFKDPKSVRTFVAALDDDYRFIRFWAVRGLIKIQDIKATVGLVKALGDEDEEIRKEVSAHLERIGEEAVPALIKAFNHPEANKFLKYGVMGLLKRIPTQKSFDAMVKALGDDNDRVVTIAIRGIGKASNPDAIRPLIDLYRTNERKRRLIEDALFRIGQEYPKVLVIMLAALLLEEDESLPALAISLFTKLPQSYIQLGDIANDKELNEDFRKKIKKVIAKL